MSVILTVQYCKKAMENPGNKFPYYTQGKTVKDLTGDFVKL